MAHVGKEDLDLAAHVVEQRLPGVVGAGHELLHDLFGIFHRIIRLHRGRAAALGLAVFPLGFLLLNMGRVPQHDAAEIHGGVGGIDGAAVPVLVQVGDLARMVDMGMGQQQRLVDARGAGQVRVFIHVASLLHAAVDQQPVPRRFQLGAAAGHFARSAQKGKFHTVYASLQRPALPVRGCGPRRRWALPAGQNFR